MNVCKENKKCWSIKSVFFMSLERILNEDAISFEGYSTIEPDFIKKHRNSKFFSRFY